jgi:hypothetical protein
LRVNDVEDAIYDGLRELPWPRYVAALCTLCELLRHQYLDWLSEDELALMANTLRMARATVETERLEDFRETAARLQTQWTVLIAEPDWYVISGQWNTWCTFADLAAEIAGLANPYSATEYLLLAATERWRTPTGKARRIDLDEEVANTSPLARTLTAFNDVVVSAGQSASPG